MLRFAQAEPRCVCGCWSNFSLSFSGSSPYVALIIIARKRGGLGQMWGSGPCRCVARTGRGQSPWPGPSPRQPGGPENGLISAEVSWTKAEHSKAVRAEKRSCPEGPFNPHSHPHTHRAAKSPGKAGRTLGSMKAGPRAPACPFFPGHELPIEPVSLACLWLLCGWPEPFIVPAQ